MGDQCGDAVRMEIGKQRHRHAAAYVDTPECHRPAGRIPAAKSHLRPALNTGSGKEKTELLNIAGHVCVSIIIALVIAEGLLRPAAADSLFQLGKIVFHRSMVFVLGTKILTIGRSGVILD